MTSGVGALVLVAALAAANGPAPAGALPAFDPQRDAHDVGKCFSAYHTLEEAALGLKPAARRKFYDRIGAEGSRRLKPFLDASVRVVGERDFFWRASGEHEPVRIILHSRAGGRAEVVKSLVLVLALEAKMCDQRVAGWGPPPKDPAEKRP